MYLKQQTIKQLQVPRCLTSPVIPDHIAEKN
jgi:hypothetical protein